MVFGRSQGPTSYVHYQLCSSSFYIKEIIRSHLILYGFDFYRFVLSSSFDNNIQLTFPFTDVQITKKLIPFFCTDKYTLKYLEEYCTADIEDMIDDSIICQCIANAIKSPHRTLRDRFIVHTPRNFVLHVIKQYLNFGFEVGEIVSALDLDILHQRNG